MKRALTYSDICLTPNYSDITTRTKCDTSVTLGNYTFDIPVIPSNMKTVVDEHVADVCIQRSCFYVMHRFQPASNVVDFVQSRTGAQKGIKYASISVGVHNQRLIDALAHIDGRVHYITIDVAHGHSLNVRLTIDYIREALGDSVFIIAGNVCTPQGVTQLYEWGADAVKVGIGQGSPCTTKDKTGFTLPMFTCVSECAEVGVPIIADGGIKCNGDIAKALVAGAKMVMIGGMFARCVDSPAETIYTSEGKRKIYYGSASYESKGEARHIEGIKTCLGMDSMTVSEKFDEIRQDLQSSISYAGGENLDVLSKSNVMYRVVT